jgi:glycosyltransferase involved in cell wall biosynthesis
VHLRSLSAALVDVGHEVTLATRRQDGPDAPDPRVRSVALPGEVDGQQIAIDRACASGRVDVVLERHSLESGAALDVARCRGLAHVLEVNAPLVREATRWRGLTGVSAALEREGAALSRTCAVIAVSEAVARHATSLGACAVYVIPNGADVDRIAAGRRLRDDTRRALGIPADAFVVGFCGAMRPWHGVVDLVEATARTDPCVRLLLVGEEPEGGCMAERADARGIGGRVRRTGARPHGEVPGLLAAMDVAAAPYVPLDDFYFSPLKSVEYLAAGLPVVASAQGNLLELIGTVELVPPGDVEALRAAVERLRCDPARRAELSRRARTAAAVRSWARVAKRVASVLATAIPARDGV